MICDRGITHEIVRHRIASYSQESTRYCNYPVTNSATKLLLSISPVDFLYDLNNETDLQKYEAWIAPWKMQRNLTLS